MLAHLNDDNLNHEGFNEFEFSMIEKMVESMGSGLEFEIQSAKQVCWDDYI